MKIHRHPCKIWGLKLDSRTPLLGGLRGNDIAHANRHGDGLTLIECLVALSLLMVGILVIFDVFSIAYVGISDARNTHLATQTARERLEIWVNHGYAWVASQPGSVSGSSSVTSQGAGVSQTVNVNWTVTHKPVVAAGVEEVDVSASWAQKGGSGTHTNSVSLGTWMSR